MLQSQSAIPRVGQTAGPKATVARLQDLIQWREATTDTPALPVHPELAAAFPSGLRAGAVYSLVGSTSMAMALLAGPSCNGSWCGVVGLPDLGAEAAVDWGVRLDRLILVPAPAPQSWVSTVAALVEIADLVVASPPARLAPGEEARLTARLRSRRATLVVTGPWPRAAADVRATTTGWDGLGQGHGCLVRQHLRLDITERHQQRSVALTLPSASRRACHEGPVMKDWS